MKKHELFQSLVDIHSDMENLKFVNEVFLYWVMNDPYSGEWIKERIERMLPDELQDFNFESENISTNIIKCINGAVAMDVFCLTLYSPSGCGCCPEDEHYIHIPISVLCSEDWKSEADRLLKLLRKRKKQEEDEKKEKKRLEKKQSIIRRKINMEHMRDMVREYDEE